MLFTDLQIENCPSVEIIEQPARRIRFRDDSELKQGLIQSINCRIRINHYLGLDTAIVVSCVLRDSPYKVHPNMLIGPGTRDGFLVGKPIGNEFQLAEVGIHRVGCARVEQVLKERARARARLSELDMEDQDLEVDPFGYGFHHARYIEEDDMIAVRLAFHVFVRNKQGLWEDLKPVVSEPILDAKVPYHPMGIKFLSASSGLFAGGETVLVELGDRVEQSTEVVFFTLGKDECKWQSKAVILMAHYNALVFSTPPYERISDHDVDAFFVVRRSSDNLCSIPCPFQYRLKRQVMHPSPQKNNGGQQKCVVQMEEEGHCSKTLNSALALLSI